jgi:hypothetical protein
LADVEEQLCEQMEQVWQLLQLVAPAGPRERTIKMLDI